MDELIVLSQAAFDGSIRVGGHGGIRISGIGTGIAGIGIGRIGGIATWKHARATIAGENIRRGTLPTSIPFSSARATAAALRTVLTTRPRRDADAVS